MGGREGLVDTAVKTAETGYMARRLMKVYIAYCANQSKRDCSAATNATATMYGSPATSSSTISHM
jgi:DNA-directed RNA polymerase beta' subunit